MLYNGDICDKLSPSFGTCYIVTKLLVPNMKDLGTLSIKFLLISLNGITVVSLGFNVF